MIRTDERCYCTHGFRAPTVVENLAFHVCPPIGLCSVVWKTSASGMAEEPETAVDDLVFQLETGSATAENRLLALFDSSDNAAAEVIDRLATSAAAGSPYSLELLLALIDDHDLARPAIVRYVKDAAVAEEVSQEVLIGVARSIHRYRHESKFSTWLFAMARNIAISEVRRQKPTKAIEEDDLLDDGAQRRMSSLVAERDMVRAAIDTLPPAFRETVLLRDVHRLSYSEIAERQGLAINTVRSRLSRGRAMLAETLPSTTGY